MVPASNGIQSAKTLNVLPDEFYAPFFSKAARNRKPDAIRSLLPLERPGIISLLAGKPNAATFPITSLQFTVCDPSAPSAEDIQIGLTDDDLAIGLQYSRTSGLPALCDWAYDLQEFSHGRKRGEGWEVTIGAGSQDLIFKAVTAFVDPGDPVLIEAPVYAGVIPIFLSLECDITEVETDSNGICSHSLREILESWPALKPKPKMLYTVPYGCNPTGMTATLERRLEILELSREHGFLILEDDPYYYLYYGKAPRPPSYFALEKEQPDAGRVIRFDSLSKILSSGIRVGFMSAPRRIADTVDVHSQAVNLQPSSLSQILALKVLHTWGLEGFKTHTDHVSQFYREKRDVFEDAMRQYLSGLAEWATPEAGMFVWFKLLLGDSSGTGTDEEHDSESIIRTQALARGVLALPGTAFLPNGRTTAYVRVSFSLLPVDQVHEALRRLREVIIDARTAAK